MNTNTDQPFMSPSHIGPQDTIEEFFGCNHYLDEEGTRRWVSEYGFVVKAQVPGLKAVIHVCDGHMVINPLNMDPTATNFDEYMLDVDLKGGEPRMAKWNPESKRYVVLPRK